MLAFVLAQLMHTPAPFMTATPAPVSERVVLQRSLDQANAHAKTLHDTLGAVVSDVTTGTDATINAEQSFPAGDGRALAIAILVLRAADAGTINLDTNVRALIAAMMARNDANAADALLERLGGFGAANASLRALGYTTLVFSPDGSLSATPKALAAMVNASRGDSLLSTSSRTMLLAALGSFHPANLLVTIDPQHLHTFVIVALHGAQGDTASARSLFAEIEGAASSTAAQF